MSGETEERVETLAIMAHTMNQAWCFVTEGDATPWDEATEEQRESMRRGVRYFLENPHASPEAQHNVWLETKAAQGWSWGPEKNEQDKTHPCFLPYNQLPKRQQAKDALFQFVLRNLLEVFKEIDGTQSA